MSRSYFLFIALTISLLLIAGCAKKPAPVAAQPAPPPPAPTASLSANPDAIEAGQSTQLTWQTQNATDISITPMGTVEPNGSRSVSPNESTTYRLTAKGPGGTQEATARVTVSAGASAQGAVSETEAQAFARNVKDVFFDYDSYDLRPEATASLQSAAAFLEQHPNLSFTIEGHCDERGSTDYNLALGDKRASAVQDALVKDGVKGTRVRTISYGKEKPFCAESNEQCWQQNRRGHFVLQR